MQAEASSRNGTDFVRGQLPWIIGAAALAVYLATLGWSMSPSGLPDLARAAGWTWQPAFNEPLHYLLTYPVRWLPVGWQIAGLNLFAAVCSSLTLVLLARSVAILPHDRTRDQRHAEHHEHSWLSIRAAWVPPVLAAAVCGLQLTFWETSVVETGEALDLLMFAYVVRNLLEFRHDQKEGHLFRLSLVYGLGITNNYAFIGFLPALIAALVWIRGLAFFNVKFLLKMLAFGTGGLLLYLLLPLAHTFDSQSQGGFLEMLRYNVGGQKNLLARFPRWSLLLVGLTSLVPIAFIGIKWPASFGDVSAAGTTLTNLMMHVIHGMLLVACLAIAFDPVFSPRKIVGIMGYPMLPFYFLGALSIGYFAGYFLLIFRTIPGATGWRKPSALRLALNRSLVGLIWLALIGVPAGLFYRNLPHIRASARPYLSELGTMQAQALKEVAPRGAIVLSDDPYRLFALDFALRKKGEGAHYVLADTSALAWARYHRHLSEQYPQQWPQPPIQIDSRARLDPNRLVQLMQYLSQSKDIFYLHPSFGYYMEQFYLKPRNLVYQLLPYPTNVISAPRLSREELIEQERVWTEIKDRHVTRLEKELAGMRARQQRNPSLGLAGTIYSRSINDIGVHLQKGERFEQAGKWFEEALKLNDDNAAAFINRDYNLLLQKGERDNPNPSEGARKRLMPFGGNFEALLGACGPVDEPNVCFRIAETFARGRNFRQAAQLLERVLEFNPEHLSARLALVSMLNQLGLHEQALAAIGEIREKYSSNVTNVMAQMELVQAEATAHLGKNEFPTAEQILLSAQKRFPKSVEPVAALAEVYVSRGQLTNAMEAVESGLKEQPEQPLLLAHYARLKMLNNDFKGAIPYLDRALANNDKDVFALLNRAIAHLKSDQLDAAQRDYESLSIVAPNSYPVVYGLHEVHWRKKHRKNAIKYAEQFLKVAPPGTPEVAEFRQRLERLKNGTF